MKTRTISATLILSVMLVSCSGHFVYERTEPKSQNEIDTEMMKKYPIYDIGNHFQYQYSGYGDFNDNKSNIETVVHLYARYGFKIVCAVPHSNNGMTYIIFERIDKEQKK